MSVWFAGVPSHADLDPEQRLLLDGLCRHLERRRPRYATPTDTWGSWDGDRYILRVGVRHASESATSLDVTLGDGYLEIDWPLGFLNGWIDPEPLLRLLSGALDGRTVESVALWRGRAVARTLVVDGERVVSHLRQPRAAIAAAGLLGVSVRRRSLSFDRTPAIVAR